MNDFPNEIRRGLARHGAARHGRGRQKSPLFRYLKAIMIKFPFDEKHPYLSGVLFGIVGQVVIKAGTAVTKLLMHIING